MTSRTTAEKIAVKRSLKAFCRQAIETRIRYSRQLMDDAQLAANGEGKSSAGDKYETSRAMNHLDKDLHAKQLSGHQQELSRLLLIQPEVLNEIAAPGACIVCTELTFFIAAGLGKQVVNGSPIIFLSPHAPLAQQLSGKKAGDTFSFNGEMSILEVF